MLVGCMGFLMSLDMWFRRPSRELPSLHRGFRIKTKDKNAPTKTCGIQSGAAKPQMYELDFSQPPDLEGKSAGKDPGDFARCIVQTSEPLVFSANKIKVLS